MPDLGASMAQAPRFEVDTGVGAADVGGAEVEGLAGDVDLDGVEELAVEDFDADDVGVAGGDELLDEGGGVEAKDWRASGSGWPSAGAAAAASSWEMWSKRLTPAPEPPMLGLTTTGKRRPSAAAGAWAGPVDDAGFGVRDAERVHEGRAGRPWRARSGRRLEAVEDFDAAGFEVLEEAEWCRRSGRRGRGSRRRGSCG